MVAASFFLLLTVAGTAFLAFGTKRGGWVGILSGALIMLILYFMVDGELTSLASGTAAAAAAAWGLPKSDRLVALAVGPVFIFLWIWVIPWGPDSPVNFMAALSAAGFTVGAALAASYSWLRNKQRQRGVGAQTEVSL